MGGGALAGTAQATSSNVVGTKISHSLNVIMEWQQAGLPSWFAIGGRDLRKLTTRVRQQPINFMIIVHQSLMTAQHGEGRSKAGLKASKILLEEEYPDDPVRDRARFTEKTLQEIKESASDLNQYTNGMKSKFRLLRTVLLDLHKDLDKVTDEGGRSDFLTRLSHYLSKDVRICKDVLQKVQDDLGEVENSLNLIIRWWQKVESEANYLQMTGESSLALEKNKITLKELRSSFATLENYFADYLDKMTHVYDANIRHLNDENRKYLKGVQDCIDLEVSKKGRLERKRK